MRRALFIVVASGAFALGLGAGYLWQQGSQAPALERATLLDTSARALPSFSLVDQEGAPFGNDRLQRRWTLMFFGYTHCPDICPLTLNELKGMYARLAGTPYPQDTQVVFVSVDPKRDTPEQLKRYVQYFDARFFGVTGSEPELLKLTRSLGIYHAVNGSGQDYLVDHSAAIVLIDDQGRNRALFSAPHEAAVLARDYLSIREAT